MPISLKNIPSIDTYLGHVNATLKSSFSWIKYARTPFRMYRSHRRQLDVGQLQCENQQKEPLLVRRLRRNPL